MSARLAVVANKDEGGLRVQRRVLAEAHQLLAGQRQEDAAACCALAHIKAAHILGIWAHG